LLSGGAYIPRGYISVAQAVDRLFEARHPERHGAAITDAQELQTLRALDRAYRGAGFASLGGGRFGECGLTSAERIQLQSLDKQEEEIAKVRVTILNDIHKALADDQVRGMVMTEFGQITPIPPEFWRSTRGLPELFRGAKDYHVAGNGPLGGRVLLHETDFACGAVAIGIHRVEPIAPSTGELPLTTPTPQPDAVLLQDQPAEMRSADSNPTPIYATDRTGSPGRPSSKHLVENEFKRRCRAGETEETITEQAKQLSAWLHQTYPGLAQMTQGTTENAIRQEFNRNKAGTLEITPRK
jgi:hypothetical protein